MAKKRQTEILKYLKNKKTASVKEIAQKFFVSEMTVRRDFKELENLGYIERYNGGASFLNDYNFMPIRLRKRLHTEVKKSLCEKAKKYIHDNMAVYIDSSSTCLYIVSLLSEYDGITVFTNSVQCLVEASKYNIKCFMAGGLYFAHDMCTVGGDTITFLQNINTDIGFFSALGISDDGIISDFDISQNDVRKAALLNCAKKIFLFETAKQHQKYPYTLCRTDEADDIIIL